MIFYKLNLREVKGYNLTTTTLTTVLTIDASSRAIVKEITIYLVSAAWIQTPDF